LSLAFNQNTGDYVIITKDRKRAEAVGLTRSTNTRGSNGEDVFFTRDGYAALPFMREADGSVGNRLGSLWTDYQASWATTSPNRYQVGQENTVFRQNGLRDYQNAGVDYVLPRPRALIADEMGIGKSATAIAVNNACGAEKVLVVCPATIRLNWRREIKKWSNLPHVRVCPIARAADGVANWPNYTVISYELARNPNIHQALRAINWDSIIIDEAHFLKSHDARRTQALFGGSRAAEFHEPLIDRAKRVMALTGTPIPNRPRECFTLSKALNWEAIDWMDFDNFSYRFNPVARFQNDDGKHVVKEEEGRLPELHARLRCNFMIRRLKKDVIKELPDKQYEFAYIESDGVISEIIKREKLIDFDPARDLKNPDFAINGMISTIRREMGMAKLPRVVEHMRYLMDIEEVPKVVLFSHHRSVMDGLKEALARYGVVEWRGGMGEKARENSLAQFQSNPDIRIFSGQLDAAGFGIDGLQNVASLAVFAEPAWVPGANNQALDRLHRIGQMFPVLGQFLVVAGSLDERVLSAVLMKAQTIHDALDNMREAA